MLDMLNDDTEVRVGLLVQSLANQHGVRRPLARQDNLVDGGFTSIAMVDLLLAVESEFNVSVPQSAITVGNFESIISLAQMITRIRSCPGSEPQDTAERLQYAL